MSTAVMWVPFLPDFAGFARSTFVFLEGGGAVSDGRATAESVLSTFPSVSAKVFFRDDTFRFGIIPNDDCELVQFFGGKLGFKILCLIVGFILDNVSSESRIRF